MKRMLITLLVILMVCSVIWMVFGGIPTRINTSFATKALLICHRGEKPMDAVIRDANDIKTLKETFAGFAYSSPLDLDDHMGHMFSVNASITLTDGRQSIIFCPNFHELKGNNTLVEIDETGKYLHLSDKKSRALDAILKKYGMVFPPR